MSSKLAFGTIAGLVLVLGAVFLIRSNRLPARVEDEQDAHSAIGRRAADEVRRLLGGKGRVVAISIDPKLTPTGDMQLRPFVEALAKEAGLTLAATEILGAPSAGAESPAPYPGRGLPAADLEQLLAKHRDAGAMVSFVGPPLLDAVQLRKLADGKTLKFAVSMLGFDRDEAAQLLKPLFAARLVDVAIVPRAAPMTGKQTSPFDRHYEVITPLSANRL